jgi:sulfur-oxidizing protein SoxX
MEADQLAGVKFPADGKLMGDWKEGEKIAQSGRGFTWTDNPGLPVGGNCYNCHKIAQGNLVRHHRAQPFQFGKLRGNTPRPRSTPIRKIYNAKATTCAPKCRASGMSVPWNEKQIKDLVALLLDPESPVNK